MAGHGTQCRSEDSYTTRTSSPVFKILPSALKARLQPLALVRRNLGGYSLGSRRRVTSLVMYQQESRDTEVLRDDSAVASSRLADSAETLGVSWKFARHGKLLHKDTQRERLTRPGSTTLQTSLAESQISDAHSQAFSRQLYLDAMAYLIQGLPSDLTDQEILHLKKALPESLKRSAPPKTIQPTERNPSLLHRSLASTIIAICLLLRLALPYIKLLVALAYNYDRAHHVKERLLAFSINTADIFGRRSMALASTAMTNEVVLGAVTYWVDGIRGGLNEGLGEGLKVIEAQNEP